MARFPLTDAYPFGEANGLSEDVQGIRNMEIEWDLSYTSTVRRGYVIELFRINGILDKFIEHHWPAGKSAEGKMELNHSMHVKERYEDFLEGFADERDIAEELDEDIDSSRFAAEADLRDYLSKNLPVIEEGLTLYEDDRGSGLEYPIEGGRIDLLALDRNDHPVVIELKLSRGRKKALGQLLYYMAWVDKNLGKGTSRGLILAREIPKELKLAVERTPGVSLLKYRLRVEVKGSE